LFWKNNLKQFNLLPEWKPDEHLEGTALEKPLAEAPEEDWKALDRLAAMRVYNFDQIREY
jgi:hypothetical protein